MLTISSYLSAKKAKSETVERVRRSKKKRDDDDEEESKGPDDDQVGSNQSDMDSKDDPLEGSDKNLFKLTKQNSPSKE